MKIMFWTSVVSNAISMVSKVETNSNLPLISFSIYQPKSTTLTCVLVRMIELELIHHVPLLIESLDHHVNTSRRHSILTNNTRLMLALSTPCQ